MLICQTGWATEVAPPLDIITLCRGHQKSHIGDIKVPNMERVKFDVILVSLSITV